MIELLELMDDVLKKKINISDFLDALILDALKSRASDIHIESKEDLSLIHTSEPTRLLSTSYAVFCLKKKPTHHRTS